MKNVKVQLFIRNPDEQYTDIDLRSMLPFETRGHKGRIYGTGYAHALPGIITFARLNGIDHSNHYEAVPYHIIWEACPSSGHRAGSMPPYDRERCTWYDTEALNGRLHGLMHGLKAVSRETYCQAVTGCHASLSVVGRAILLAENSLQGPDVLRDGISR